MSRPWLWTGLAPQDVFNGAPEPHTCDGYKCACRDEVLVDGRVLVSVFPRYWRSTLPELSPARSKYAWFVQLMTVVFTVTEIVHARTSSRLVVMVPRSSLPG